MGELARCLLLKRLCYYRELLQVSALLAEGEGLPNHEPGLRIRIMVGAGDNGCSHEVDLPLSMESCAGSPFK